METPHPQSVGAPRPPLARSISTRPLTRLGVFAFRSSVGRLCASRCQRACIFPSPLKTGHRPLDSCNLGLPNAPEYLRRNAATRQSWRERPSHCFCVFCGFCCRPLECDPPSDPSTEDTRYIGTSVMSTSRPSTCCFVVARNSPRRLRTFATNAPASPLT